MADGPPAARPAPDRQPERRTGLLGPRVPGPAGHRPDRLHHHGRLPGRLRSVLRQAVRRPAPRLGRPAGLGGKGHRPLREARHRSAEQDPGVLRRARPGEVAAPLPCTFRANPRKLRGRHQPDLRHPRRRADEHRDQDDRLQRPTRGEDFRHARQDPMPRREFRQLPETRLSRDPVRTQT
ncbi:UNVERIFIED_CONTAM: hypothetical protein NCL1_58931 [Trichonephila clavipes]